MKTIGFPVYATLLITAGPLFSADDPPGGKRLGSPPVQSAQPAWTEAGTRGNFLLNSERFREGLGLSEKQRRQIESLAEQAGDLWNGYREKAAAEQEKYSDAAMRILTEPQRDELVKLNNVTASWFSVLGYGDTLADLGVGEKEREKIKGIMEAHRKERTEVFGQVAQTDPEAVKRAREFQEQHRRSLEKAKKEVRGILGKANIEALIDAVVRTRLQSLLHQERYMKELKFTDEQSEKIAELNKKRGEIAREMAAVKDAAERAEKWKEWSEKSLDEGFAILTDEQKRRLRNLDVVEAMWFSALSWPGMAVKIDISEDRKNRLDAVLEGYREKRTAAYRPDPKAAERMREVREKYQKMLEESKEAVRAVLSDAEFDALLVRIARTQLPYLFRRADVAEKLGLSEKQIGKIDGLAKNQSEGARNRSAKISEKRRALGEKAESILSDEQKKKLDEMIKAPRPVIRVQGGRGGASKPAAPKKEE